MALECVLFWVWCWFSYELAASRFVANLLAAVLALLLLLAALLIQGDLDLLGFFVGSVYSSVFLAVALVALQFGPY